MTVTDRRFRRRFAALGVALVVAVLSACADTDSAVPAVTPTATPIPVSPDRTALVALYNATDGPNWTNREYWLSDQPVSEWHGVTTDSDAESLNWLSAATA